MMQRVRMGAPRRVSVVVLALAAAAVISASRAPVNLRLVTYNVQLFPNLLQDRLYVNNRGRIEYIPTRLYQTALQQFGNDAPPDIICFEEAFSSDFRSVAAAFADSHGYTLAAPNPPKFWRLQFVNSGVMLLSKTPFLHLEYHDYPIAATCGFDRFAAKGFVYGEIEKGGVRIGIVATHLQADDSLCKNPWETSAAVSRRKQVQQLAEIHAFLQRQPFSDRPKVDALFLVGDMNLSALDLSVTPPVISWNQVANTLGAIGAHPMQMVDAKALTKAPISSFDPSSNDYFARLKQKHPPAEHIDYVLALGAPANSVRNMIVPIKAANGERFRGDLSDHHSVMAYTWVVPPRR